jgi:hypothetical protein
MFPGWFKCQILITNQNRIMKTRNFFILALLLLTGIFSSYGQRGYTELKTEDNIKVMYRWQRLQHFNKNSDAVLNLRLTNLSESHVVLTYSLNFYENKIAVYESETQRLCLKPGQSLRGGYADLRFTVEGMKLEMVERDTFSWEFFDFDVEEVESCE